MLTRAATVFAVVILSALIAPVANAGVLGGMKAGNTGLPVNMSFPSGWTVNQEDGAVVGHDPRHEVEIRFKVTDDTDLRASADDTMTVLKKNNVKLMDPSTGEVNGMPDVMIGGVGENNAAVLVVLIKVPDGRVLAAVALGNTANFANHQDEMLALFNSITPTK